MSSKHVNWGRELIVYGARETAELFRQLWRTIWYRA